jgi:DNA-binding NtrC family response regulator
LMKNISSVVEKAVRKHLIQDIPDLKYNISTNLEFRLFFPLNTNKPFKEAKKNFLKNYLNDILTLSLGNISMAARKANLNRRHLHRIITELDINPDTHRKELLKPTQYLKDNIQNILEETLFNLKPDEKLRNVYSNLEQISESLAKNMDESMSYEEAVELFEKEFLGKALKENNYNIPKTAEILDMSERTLYRKISKLNLAIA